MSCASRSVLLSWIVGRKSLGTTFRVRIDKSIAVADGNGWDQTHGYICDHAPIFQNKGYTSDSLVIELAQSEMSQRP